MKKSEVGELRPSQLLLTFGVGAIVDLPNMSVMVMGLDDWPVRHSAEIGEDRLLLSVQNTLGTQVKKLLTPPRAEESVSGQTSWFDEAHQIGVPVVPFPRWMVCPSAGCWPRSIPACSSPRPRPIGPTRPATSTTARRKGHRPRSFPPGSWWPASTGIWTISLGWISSTGARPTARGRCECTSWACRARPPMWK